MTIVASDTKRLRPVADDPDTRTRILARNDAERIIQSLMTKSRQYGETEIVVGSIWQQTLKWARNRVTNAGNVQKRLLLLTRKHPGYTSSSAGSNQFDDATLQNMLAIADLRGTLIPVEGQWRNRVAPFLVDIPSFTSKNAQLWSDTTAQATAESRARLATMLSTQADDKGLLSAGSVEIRAASISESDPAFGFRYSEYTHVYSSVTVRNPSGTGSGWAGESGFDWGRIDAMKIAGRALEKCVASIDPVRIEPGRYTVVLEPQAVHGLVSVLMAGMSRSEAHHGRGPFAAGKDAQTELGMTKLGMKVVDERVTIFHDPSHIGTGVVPKAGLAPLTWIDRGILTTLEDGMDPNARLAYSLPERNDSIANLKRPAFEMQGGATPVDEMIRTTKRGLLVTRFWDINMIDKKSLLATGVTRDGLWLIENGAITKAVKNLRFIESPLFVLNQLDQLGEAVQVFVPMIAGGGHLLGTIEFMFGPLSAIVPPIKANDFNFVALVDAV